MLCIMDVIFLDIIHLFEPSQVSVFNLNHSFLTLEPLLPLLSSELLSLQLLLVVWFILAALCISCINFPLLSVLCLVHLYQLRTLSLYSLYSRMWAPMLTCMLWSLENQF
jgi:hypothetical protein